MSDYSTPGGQNADILNAIIDGTEYENAPTSEISALLLELKEAIEQGGDVTLSQLIEDVTGYPLNDFASMSLYSKDLNTITKSGFYNAMTCTNAPFNYMTLTVIGYYMQGYTVQIACDVTTGEVKRRNNINGTWSAWTTTKELPAVTSTDNDSVLTVVDGTWDKAQASGGGFQFENRVSVDTGMKWLDGSPIKVFSFNHASASSAGSVNDNLSWFGFNDSISRIIFITGFVIDNVNGYTHPLNGGGGMINNGSVFNGVAQVDFTTAITGTPYIQVYYI